MKTLKEQLLNDKIEINWNKKPIDMKFFLKCLNVPFTKSTNHLGSDNGWTRYENKDIKLEIGGGIVGGTEYLDRIQYGTKLQNPYNNYVNPFYLFDIINEDGKKFFIDYYKEDIEKILSSAKQKVHDSESKVIISKNELFDLETELETLYNEPQTANINSGKD